MFRSSKHKIPQKLLEDVLTDIETGTKNLFCSTRRSAGMPFIIQVINLELLIILTHYDIKYFIGFALYKS